MRLFIPSARFFSYCLAMASYKQRIARLLGVRVTQVRRIYGEIDNSDFMRDIIVGAGLKKGFFNFSMTCPLRAPTLYVLCRLLEPEIIVETGVADGFSSFFILNALQANKKGHLYSIDLPNQPGQELKDGKITGWFVPESLKNRWTLIIGSSKERLPLLLSELKEVNIFYHDSDHSYENMMFEFKEAWPYLKESGILVSDDITDNQAFDDFSRLNQNRFLKLFKLGIIKKCQNENK